MPAPLKTYPCAYSEYSEYHEKIPERRLLEAVLWRAVNDLLPEKASVKTDQKDIREAHAWLFERGDDGFMSFLNVCRVLDRDPERIRREMRVVMGKRPFRERRRYWRA